VATIIAAVVFAVRAHRLRGGRLAVVCFVLALGWWFAVVNTANAEVGRWAVDASDWRRWRAQWEFGHAGHCVVTFAGFLALLGATVRGGAPDHRRVLVAPSPSPGNRPPWHELGRHCREGGSLLLRRRTAR
jgi:hypothetical protein